MYLSNEGKIDRTIIAVISTAWALFQLALPRFIILDSITIRAVHLAFAITLVLLTYPLQSKRGLGSEFLHSANYIWLLDYTLAGLACFSALYIVLDWTGISMRAGLPIWRDIAVSVILIILVLEASKRVIGSALTVIVILFTVYAFLGPYMPPLLAFRGVTLRKYLSQVALSTEGI